MIPQIAPENRVDRLSTILGMKSTSTPQLGVPGSNPMAYTTWPTSQRNGQQEGKAVARRTGQATPRAGDPELEFISIQQ
jgi:hypothetical protein